MRLLGWGKNASVGFVQVRRLDGCEDYRRTHIGFDDAECDKPAMRTYDADWHWLCDYGADDDTAKVACRQLGLKMEGWVRWYIP